MTEQLPFHFSLSCIGGGNDDPLQCSCLESPRDGGACWAAVYGVAQSETWLKRLSSSSSSSSRGAQRGWGKRNVLLEHSVLEQRCPAFLAPGTGLTEDSFPQAPGEGKQEGFRMIQAHYIYCVLYFYCYYISSISDFLATETGFLEDKFSRRGGGNGFRMIQAHYIYCALYFCYYVSSTSEHQALDARGWRPLRLERMLEAVWVRYGLTSYVLIWW